MLYIWKKKGRVITLANTAGEILAGAEQELFSVRARFLISPGCDTPPRWVLNGFELAELAEPHRRRWKFKRKFATARRTDYDLYGADNALKIGSLSSISNCAGLVADAALAAFVGQIWRGRQVYKLKLADGTILAVFRRKGAFALCNCKITMEILHPELELPDLLLASGVLLLREP